MSEQEEPPMSLTPESFRAWAAQWPGGITVVTSGSGERTLAATVSAFMPVSHAPALAAIFVGARGRLSALVRATRRWSVSVLGEDGYVLARHFAHPARVTGDAALRQIGIVEVEGYPPVLAGAAAWLACELELAIEIGDHLALIGRVARAARDPAVRPLLAWRGKLHQLGEPAAPPAWSAPDGGDPTGGW
ncbi:MAG TPA: flavin reductase family protein [Ktedonobacterales bacterium]